MRVVLALVAASVLGLGLGLVDTRPNWDDSGISAGARKAINAASTGG